MDRVNLAVGQPSVGLKIAGSSERFVSRRGFFSVATERLPKQALAAGPKRHRSSRRRRRNSLAWDVSPR